MQPSYYNISLLFESSSNPFLIFEKTKDTISVSDIRVMSSADLDALSGDISAKVCLCAVVVKSQRVYAYRRQVIELKIL